METKDLNKKTNDSLVAVIELNARSFRSIQMDLELKIKKLEEQIVKLQKELEEAKNAKPTG